jgi:predicted O-methyltransferase YrrM
MLIVNDALDGDRVAEPAVREASTNTLRQVGRTVREHEKLLSALLPTGSGLLLAVKRQA